MLGVLLTHPVPEKAKESTTGSKGIGSLGKLGWKRETGLGTKH